MKKLAICALLFVSFLGLGLWLLVRHWRDSYRSEVESTKSRFMEDKATFEPLAAEWLRLHPDLNECGLPDPQPGLVQFALFAREADGRFRVAKGMQDQTYRDIGDASAAMKTDPATLRNFDQRLQRLSITAVLQHQSELKFKSNTSSPIGIMFVPPACPKSAYYEATARLNPDPEFTVFQKLANNWYFYEEKR
jgi:hypothetical protein